jgi:anti-sigma regulatory factor (Ser/Thr protein kinase)
LQQCGKFTKINARHFWTFAMLSWIRSWFRKPAAKTTAHWRFELKGSRAEIGGISEAFDRLAQGESVPESTVRTLQVALDELLTNALSYGKVSPAQPAKLEILLSQGELRAVLRYADEDFNPFLQARAPDLDASVSNRDIGGLGVHLVKEMVDEHGYQHAAGLSTIAIAKRF